MVVEFLTFKKWFFGWKNCQRVGGEAFVMHNSNEVFPLAYSSQKKCLMQLIISFWTAMSPVIDNDDEESNKQRW